MSCTCTEDKFLYDQTTQTETPWDGVAQGIIIGRNRVMCQECIDQNAKQEKERADQEEIAKIKQEAMDALLSAHIEATPALKARMDKLKAK